MTGNVEEAKEVCQDAVIKIYRYLHTFKKGSSFKTWIYKSVINSSYDYLRRKKKQETVLQSQKDMYLNGKNDPEKHFLQKELMEKIEYCLQSLSPKEKAVFILRDSEGFSIKETSEILKCSSMSVRTHLSRARQKIRVQFEKIYQIKTREKQE